MENIDIVFVISIDDRVLRRIVRRGSISKKYQGMLKFWE